MKGTPRAIAPAALPPSETNVRLFKSMFSFPKPIAACRPFSLDHAHYFMSGPGQGTTIGMIMHLPAELP
jgi:hypothetical protein